MDFFEENSEKSSQDEVGVVADEVPAMMQGVETQRGVEEDADMNTGSAMGGPEVVYETPVDNNTAGKPVASPKPQVAVSSSSDQSASSPKSRKDANGSGVTKKDDIRKAARRLLSGDDSDSSDSADDSSSDSSTEEDDYTKFIQGSAPAPVIPQQIRALNSSGTAAAPGTSSTAEEGGSLASAEQMEELKRLYIADRDMLVALQEQGTAYGHTYSHAQLENTFKYYLSQNGDGIQAGIAVLQFVYTFFEAAILESNLGMKIKQSQANIVELKTRVKELRTQRLLDEGYDKDAVVKVAIQERGENDVEAIKHENGKNILRGNNWGQAIPMNEITNPEWLKQGISKIIVDNPEKKSGSFHAYIIYRVLIFTKSGKILMVQRRFNHLKKLYKDLKVEVHCNLPHLPPEKHWLLGGSNSMFVIKRIEEIRSFLEKITQTREAVNSQALRDFCLIGAQWRDASEGY